MKSIIFALTFVVMCAFTAAQNPVINVDIKGEGTPIVLIPGFGCPADVWNETVASLSNKHKCYIVSCAGFAGMAPIDTLWLSRTESSIENLVSEIGDNVTIIGHSYGGAIGLMVAKALPNNVKRLVVVEMLPCIGQTMIPNYKPEYVTFDNPYNQRMLSMSETDFASTQQQSAANMTANTARQKQIIDWMVSTDRRTYVYEYTELLRTDLREAIADVKQPTLVLAAGRYPTKEQILQVYEEQYRLMPNKVIKFIDNSSHFIMFDQFDSFIVEVTKFLE